MTFYMTYSRSRPDTLVPYMESENIPIMTSAALRWSDNTERLLDPFEYGTRRIIDSGGYSVQASHGGYPWSVREYHEWLSEHQDGFEWAACMDLACEERFDDIWSVEERVDQTIENTVKQFEMGPEYELVPVIQGRSADTYVECYERMEDRGIPMDKIGLGTVCRISNTDEIVALEEELRERLDPDHIHGFGVKISAIDSGTSFESMDSHAWVYAPSNGKVVRYDGEDMSREPMPDDSFVRTVLSFMNYHECVMDKLVANWERKFNDTEGVC